MLDGFQTATFDVRANIADEAVMANMQRNVSRPLPRLGLLRACLVGGGPSLADTLDLLKQRQEDGWAIISLNATHDWLIERNLLPNHHVTYDARPLMAGMVRNWMPGCHYLVASRCDPAVFEALDGANVTMFHAVTVMEARDLLREKDPGSLALEGLSTVGLEAINVAMVLGFRELELHGYDSSWRQSNRHAYAQEANAAQDELTFRFEGVEYRTSAPMASQAHTFRELLPRWMARGTIFHVVGDGLLPAMWRSDMGIGQSLEEREARKYARMWAIDAYRENSPALRHLDEICAALDPKAGDTVIDFGCGQGLALETIEARTGAKVVGVDIAPNALEATVPLCVAFLWDLPDTLKGTAGLCVDVMEHMPPETVEDVLAGIRRTISGAVYFAISLRMDDFGVLIGQSLHTCVRPHEWWLSQLQQHWTTVESLAEGRFLVKP